MKNITWPMILLAISTALNILGGTSVIHPFTGDHACPPTHAPLAPAAEVDDAGLTK